MANKRDVDVSKMFRSSARPLDEGLTSAPAVPAAPAAPEEHVTSNIREKKKTLSKGLDSRNKQSEKLSFYLTPRICEALKLHKSTHFIGVHNDSKLINEALSEFFRKELSVLDSLDPELPHEVRLQEAMRIIFSSHEQP